ncbi:MAG: virulence factor SrfC family protein [Pseudomonadota bacterium]
MTSQDLYNRGEALSTAAQDARRWVSDAAQNSARVKTEAADLLACALQTDNDARKLARAARRRMCIGVFGPSQAGKSYLVSRLAKRPSSDRDDEERLVTRLGAQEFDFLSKINPPGDKESTGLVTRFTKEARDVPADFPVAVRLFTETDIVKVFANIYFLDFDHHNLEFEPPKDEAAVGQILQSVSGDANGQPLAHLDEVAIYDLVDYFHRSFKASSQFLDDTRYWDVTSRVVSRLPLEKRAALFSVLWGGIEQFTTLYKDLVRFLEELNFADEAYVEVTALTPRGTSIIDVDRIKLGLGSAADAADTLGVTTDAMLETDQSVQIPRATLCALVAELCLPVQNATWPIFDNIDLLDFPGARSREKYRRIDEKTADDEELLSRARELFIRGKVAMLFQRYSEERELSSMLLCMPPSNAEVKDLGIMVRDWVNLTHGNTANERTQQPNALFLVLTKSDADFESKEGEDDASRAAKWNRRLEASVWAPYRRDRWLDEWDEVDGQPRAFRNVLWLRNPSVQQLHLIDEEMVDDVRYERDLAEAIKPQLPELKQHFLNDMEVTQHFAEPEAAFDALLTLNDGGIRYLIDRLVPVCDPATKDQQVQARLNQVATHFQGRFLRYFEAEGDASRERRRQEAGAAIESIGRALTPSRFRGFGEFVRDMAAQPDDFYGLYMNIARFGVRSESVAEPATDAALPEQTPSSLFDLSADDEPDESPSTTKDNGGANVAAGDPRSADFAQQAVADWLHRIRETASADEDADKESADARTFIVEQLVTAAHRRELPATIMRTMSAQGQVISTAWEDLAELGALVAANEINALVASLGYADLPEEERPPVPPPPAEMRRRAFPPVTPNDASVPTLGRRRRPVEVDYAQDWLASLVQLSVDNIGFSSGRDITPEQNEMLGAILNKSSPAEAGL